LVCERQGEGNTIIRNFIKWGYPEHKLYHGTKNTPGIHTNQFNRDDMLAELRTAIRTKTLVLRCEQSVIECKGFGRNAKTGKLEGIYGHDDEVMSLAFVQFGLTQKPAPIKPEEWQPKSYMEGGNKSPFGQKINWRKKYPLMCVFIIREEGKQPRRCGIHHNSLEDMNSCQHLS
jgi:hypothetical protein